MSGPAASDPIADIRHWVTFTNVMAFKPAFLAKALLSAYAIAALALILLAADAIDVLLFGLLLGVPWIVLPFGITAIFVVASDQPIRSWGGLTIEVAVISSSVWAGVELLRHPDAQNGIAIALLPAIQIGAALASFFAVMLFELAVERLRQMKN